MNGVTQPATEAELHAYLDGELSLDRIEAIEAHFLTDEADALRFGIYRRQSDLMRRLFDQLEHQPVTNDMLPLIQTVVRIRPKRSRLGIVLMSLVVVALGAAVGWFGHQYFEAPRASVAATLNEALAAHRISQRQRPAGIEVLGGDGRSTLEWLEREYGFHTIGPELEMAGVAPVAGQLVPSSEGIAAQLLLRTDAGERLTLYVRPGGPVEFTHFRSIAGPSERMVTWQSHGATLVLLGDLADERLLPVAEAIQAAVIEPGERTDTPT